MILLLVVAQDESTHLDWAPLSSEFIDECGSLWNINTECDRLNLGNFVLLMKWIGCIFWVIIMQLIAQKSESEFTHSFLVVRFRQCWLCSSLFSSANDIIVARTKHFVFLFISCLLMWQMTKTVFFLWKIHKRKFFANLSFFWDETHPCAV